jgi:alkylation response protein AidB-like acyl-CoA dehydrogenase
LIARGRQACAQRENWVINGAQTHITNAAQGDWSCVLAWTSDEAATGVCRRSWCRPQTLIQAVLDRTVDYLRTRAARFLRDARLLAIGGGADEVTLHTISPLGGFITGEGS